MKLALAAALAAATLLTLGCSHAPRSSNGSPSAFTPGTPYGPPEPGTPRGATPSGGLTTGIGEGT